MPMVYFGVFMFIIDVKVKVNILTLSKNYFHRSITQKEKKIEKACGFIF